MFSSPFSIPFRDRETIANQRVVLNPKASAETKEPFDI